MTKTPLDPARTPTLAAFALGERILPIGYRRNGRPIFPIAGGAPDDPPKEDPKLDPAKDDDPPKFTPIGSQEELNRIIGERLNREKAKFADYEDLKTKAAAHDKAMADAMTEQEKAVAAAKESGKTEAISTVNSRLIASEARALAAEARFRNPGLAVKALDLAGVKVNDAGEVDAAAIKTLLADLAKDEPYLIDDGKKPAPKPDKSQGGDKGGDDTPSVNKGREMFENRRGAKKTSA